MKLTNTQIKTVAVTLVVLVLFGIYFIFFGVIKSKNNEISELQNRVDTEVRKDQRLHSTKQLMTDLGKELKQIDTYFVSEEGVVDFLEELESLGSIANASVGVNSVRVEEGFGRDLPYELLNIEFVSRGTWSSIIQMISLLESFVLGLTIDRMQLERLSNSNSWLLNTSFSVLKLK